MSSFVIRQARLIDPSQQRDEITDIRIVGGKIDAIGADLSGSNSIDASGLWLTPGFIDLGGHLAEPGYTQKGSIASETKAASRSGFTHVCALPDSKPVADSAAVIQLIREKAEQAGSAEVLPLGALTQGLEGEQLANMFSLSEAGCVAMSNARQPIKDSYVLRRLLEYAATYYLPVFLTANDAALAAGGCMHEGPVSTRLGLAGIPETAETAALAQIILLAEQVPVRLHISQISCARSIAMLRNARSRGHDITADVPLANLLYTEDTVHGYNSQFHVQPPLRSEDDRQALLAAVAAGELAISSNHRPHEIAAKKAPFADAEAGLSMYDYFLPLALSLLDEQLDIGALVRSLTQLPAQVLGRQASLALGSAANLVLIDPQQSLTARRSELLSRGGNISCRGDVLTGQATAVMRNGHWIYQAD